MKISETSPAADDTNAAPSPETEAAAGSRPLSERPAVRLGFTRGTAPSKWASRWQGAGYAPLDLQPFARPFGRGGNTADVDVVLERTRPGERPEGSFDTDAKARTRHAVGLYTEALGLVVAADHDLADSASITLEELALVKVLDYPDHCPEWPAAEPWADPAWMPKHTVGALEIVATGAGGILLPLPLARHMTRKRDHAIIALVDADGSAVSAGTRIWASWTLERDAADVQQLSGIMRGRTARSSRPLGESDVEAKASAKSRVAQQRREQYEKQKKAAKKAQLKPGSRGAQLAAAKDKADRARALKRAEKKRK